MLKVWLIDFSDGIPFEKVIAFKVDVLSSRTGYE